MSLSATRYDVKERWEEDFERRYGFWRGSVVDEPEEGRIARPARPVSESIPVVAI